MILEHISDGISENIITSLSKVAEIFVIARQSAFSYKGKPVKVKQVAEEMGLTNITAAVSSGEELPRSRQYDLIITFDCIHDMTRPQQVMGVLRKLIKDDGTWFIKDIRSKSDFQDNLRNPMLAMMYGFSLMSCMSSAMSEEGGAGLGTLGFNPEVAEAMCREAGFTRFKMHDFKDPGNLYYEVSA